MNQNKTITKTKNTMKKVSQEINGVKLIFHKKKFNAFHIPMGMYGELFKNWLAENKSILKKLGI